MNRMVYYLHAANNIKLELGFNNAPMHCRAASNGKVCTEVGCTANKYNGFMTAKVGRA